MTRLIKNTMELLIFNNLRWWILYITITCSANVYGDRGSFLGCYQQNLYLPRLKIFSGSSDVCINACKSEYYRYAVLDGNACLCTNLINEKELESDKCDRPCTEHHEEFCGGEYSQSYFATEIKVPGKPQNLQIFNQTDRSLIIQWVAPEQMDSLSKYIIKADIVKKYGSNILEPLPEWTVESNNRNVQYELFDLQPGSTYNFTIRSNSQYYGDGGVSWIIGELDIGIPEPKPTPPIILSSNEKTMTIEIPPLINNHGPISAVQVVVMISDTEISQKFDVNLLGDYKKASDDGLNYYVTAELTNEKTARKFVIGNGLNYGGFDNVPLPIDHHVRAILGVISQVGNVTKKQYSIEEITEDSQIIHFIDTNNKIDNGDHLKTILTIGCTILAILLLLSIAGYWYIRYRIHPNMQRLPSDNHELTLQGPIIHTENNDNAGYQPSALSKTTFDQKLNEILREVDSSKNYPRNRLILDVTNVIANGQYGTVISGKIESKEGHVHVISDDMDPLNQVVFLKELDASIQLGFHKNITEFYGICQSNIWLYLMFESNEKSLKTFLIESRNSSSTEQTSFSSMSEKTALQILCEISTAMEFLNKNQHIHGKITSHNIWMTNSNIPKISIFGTPFNKHGKNVDLSRWSAPEVLRFQHYSTYSDVWSFACIMWEVCSLGGTLYSNIDSNDLVYRMKEGFRPERLSFVHDDMFQLLHNCWQLEPNERPPSFGDITSLLWQFLSSPKHIISFKNSGKNMLPKHLPLLEEQHQHS